MANLALEFVPPNIEDGKDRAVEEAQKVQELSREFGLQGKIDCLMIPGMIDEDDDRPVRMKPKMDPLHTWQAASPHLPDMWGICT